MENIYTVSGLTEDVRKALTRHLPFVWVRGEISNLSRPASGHIYFSLKDEASQVQCAWFSGKQAKAGQNFDPLTGECYDSPRPAVADMLANGMEALLAGSIDVYAQRGVYQLLVEVVQPAGSGLLALQFEQNKARLAQAGYFNQSRKRLLPGHPARIALITSPHGAAIHDFLELAQNRGLGSQIRLFPVPVQGQDAARKIAAAIELANAQAWADVIVIIRGGGSLEDLWAFNEEPVATAIFQSALPVLAGIGHEVDVTLADMTADVRAATPSHAAQLLWRPRYELEQQLDSITLELEKSLANRIGQAERQWQILENGLKWLSPGQKLKAGSDRLALLAANLHKNCEARLHKAELALAMASMLLTPAMNNYLASKAGKVENLAAILASLDPYQPLKRGYALLLAGDQVVKSIADANLGDKLQALVGDGSFEVQVLAKEALHELAKAEN